MVSRRKLRTLLSTLGLYVGCALVIGYFGVNAYTGNHGLRAQQDLDQQFTALTDELGQLKHERADWQRRVKLLQSSSIDPDMLDERARAVLELSRPARSDPDAQAALTAALQTPAGNRPAGKSLSDPDICASRLSRCTSLSYAFASLRFTLLN